MGYNESLLSAFPGMVVNKEIVREFRGESNIPSYVIEYLVSAYCCSDDPTEVEDGKAYIRELLAENFAKPEKSEFIKYNAREYGSYKIIDLVSVEYNEDDDVYVTKFANFQQRGITMPRDYIHRYNRLTIGGVWAVVEIAYVERGTEEENDEETAAEYNESRFSIASFAPIQMASFDVQTIIDARKHFSTDDWRALILRSIGYEPSALTRREQFHIIERLVPLAEKNYNLCELGARSTGKSFVYKNTSPYSILMTGGETTVANMFYNMGTRQPGLIARWDCVAFDEVAGLKSAKNDLANSLKDYMESGSIARGQITIPGEASIVLNGNTETTPEQMIRNYHLFAPFPQNIRDNSAFCDRLHYYIPGWESPKLEERMFTLANALSVNVIAEFLHEMRGLSYSYLFTKEFSLDGKYKTRDEKAIKKTFSGLAKILYPNGDMTRDEIRELLEYSIEGRLRVREQLAVMVPNEYSGADFGYKDNFNLSRTSIECPEQLEV